MITPKILLLIEKRLKGPRPDMSWGKRNVILDSLKADLLLELVLEPDSDDK
jgi:hypothetical protein